MSLENCSCCFICCNNYSPYFLPRGDNRLNELLPLLCKVMSIFDIPPQLWHKKLAKEVTRADSMGEDCLRLVCEQCYQILVSMEQLNALLERTKKSLETCVKQVETLILTSQDQTQSDLWTEPFVTFRTCIIKANSNPNPFCSDPEDVSVLVKNEPEVTSDINTSWDSDDPGVGNDLLSNDFQTKQATETNDSITLDIPEEVKMETMEETDEKPFPRRRSLKTKTKAENNARSQAKRKFTNDRLSNSAKQARPSTSNSTSTRRSRRMSARIAMEKVKVDSDNSDFELEQSTSTKQNRKVRKSTVPLRTADMKDDMDSDFEPDKQSEEPQNNEGKKIKVREKPTRNRDPHRHKIYQIGEYMPIIFINEDLCLYRWGTFVSRVAHSQLKCLAYQCSFTVEGTEFDSIQDMKYHIAHNHKKRKHLQRTPHQCHLCDKTFPNQESFRKHFPIHSELHPSTRVSSICESCRKICPMKHVRVHMFSHKNGEEQASAFTANDVPLRRMRPKESEMIEKNFICDYQGCTSAFKSSRNLRRHKQTHLPRELRTDLATCDECGVRILKESLKEHVEKFHHPERIQVWLSCSFCDKKFLPAHNSLFQAHLRKHKGEEPFMCSFCGKTFASKANLNSHFHSMHKERGKQESYQCQFCEKMFVKNSSLKAHLRRNHSVDLKPKENNRGQTSKFYREIEKPTGEVYGPVQMFPCPQCDVITKHNFTLKKHILRRHYGIKPDKNGKFPKVDVNLVGDQNGVNYVSEMDTCGNSKESFLLLQVVQVDI